MELGNGIVTPHSKRVLLISTDTSGLKESEKAVDFPEELL